MSDSRVDTYQHIHLLQGFLMTCIVELQDRLLEHDAAKLESPEVEAYDGLAERLRQEEYGSEGYRAVLRSIKPAIQHHYGIYRHHPEHFSGGVKDMNLLDLLEMVCDWLAASKRQGGGNDLREAMPHNQERWGIGDELMGVLGNTLDVLEPPRSIKAQEQGPARTIQELAETIKRTSDPEEARRAARQMRDLARQSADVPDRS